MASLLTVAQILQLKNVSQYLSLNEIAYNNSFLSGDLDERVARMIYVEGKSVQIRYNQNPNDPTLVATANYLYTILKKWALNSQVVLIGLSVALPVIAGPANVIVNVGQDAVFLVSITSTVPFTLQWYDINNNPIAGATGLSYTFTNAQITDNNKTFYVKATNSAGTVTSTIAVLVVNAALTGQFYYGDTDFSAQLLAGTDNVPYNGSFTVTNGQPIVVPFPLAAANNKFIYVQYPATQPTKTIWFNTALNQGTIPDSVYQNHADGSVVIIGSNKYIISRGQITQDSTQPQVTYS